MKRSRRIIGFLIILCGLTLNVGHGQEWWPRFRGPNGSGVASDEANPPMTFGPEKNVQWKMTVPEGSSSPVIWGDHLYLTAFQDDRLKTLCYHREDGRKLWERLAPTVKIQAYFEKSGSPAASSVATDNDRVVAYFGSFGVLCYDHQGNELWKRRLEVPEDPFSFGTGTSPILAKGLVIVQRDYEPTQSHLLALDAKTGETRWQTARAGYPTSYGTPMVWRHDDKAELIVTGSLRVCGYDLDKGQETWNAAGMCAFVCTSAVASSNNLFVASWSTGSYGEPFPEFKVLASGDSDKDGKLTSAEFGRTIPGDFFVSFDQNSDGFLTKDEWDYVRDYASRGKNALMAIRPGGSGDITDTHVEWKVEKGIPYVPSPLYYQGQVYVVKDGGLVSSVDAETGKPHYHRKRLGAGGDYYASPIAAGGRVYLASLNGEIVVIEAGPELKILASNDFEERLSATPAIVGDTLYLRTAKHLYALR